jgi:hypothetical protein
MPGEGSGRRYAGAAGLADDLQAWLRAAPVRAQPRRFAPALWRWGRRKSVLAGFAVFAVLLALAVAASRWRVGDVEASLGFRQTETEGIVRTTSTGRSTLV